MISKNCWGAVIFAQSADRFLSSTNIFASASTPARSIWVRSSLVLSITAAILDVALSLLAYCVARFRGRRRNQVELAWTFVPVLIVLALLHDQRTREERE